MRSYEWPILLFCGAIFLSPVNDAIVKLVTDELSIAEVICIRALFCACFLLCIKNNVREITRTEIGTLFLLVCRATLLSMSMFLYIYSLRFLPLSIAVSIFYLAPVFISLLSPVFLREPMRLNNIIFVLIGFIWFKNFFSRLNNATTTSKNNPFVGYNSYTRAAVHASE